MTNKHEDTAWPAEAVATLCEMWATNTWHSIADQLRSEHGLIVSRSAICGKAHRLKLGGKKTGPVIDKPKVRKVRQVRTAGSQDTAVAQVRAELAQVQPQVGLSSNLEAAVGAGADLGDLSLTEVQLYGANGGIVGRTATFVITDDLAQPNEPRSRPANLGGWAAAGASKAPTSKLDIADYGCSTSVGFLREHSVKAECKWPTNDDIQAMTVCGQPAVCGAYCAAHGTLAYQPNNPPTAKRNKRFHARQEFDL